MKNLPTKCYSETGRRDWPRIRALAARMISYTGLPAIGTDPDKRRAGGRAYQAEQRRKNPEQAKRWARASYRRNADKRAETGLKKRYGLTKKEVDQQFAVQGGQCAICSRAGLKLNVDHNHSSGAIRGLLCTRCNLALGGFQDSQKLLLLAMNYLEAWEKL